jgi:hypothetical protein
MLSDRANTPHLVHCAPQIAMLMMTGTISLAAMVIFPHDSGHRTWNHWPLSVTAPQPQDPEASAVTTCDGASGGIMDRPFHLGRKDAHHCRSDLKPAVSLTW